MRKIDKTLLLFVSGPIIIAIVIGLLLATHTTFLKDQTTTPEEMINLIANNVAIQETPIQETQKTRTPQIKKRDDD